MNSSLMKEIDTEIARNKPASWARLMWQGIKAMTGDLRKETQSLRQELEQLREFVNSPDNEHRTL